MSMHESNPVMYPSLIVYLREGTGDSQTHTDSVCSTTVGYIIVCSLCFCYETVMPIIIHFSTSMQRPLVQMDEAREQQITNLLNSVKSEPPGASRDGCDVRAASSNSWRAAPRSGSNHW